MPEWIAANKRYVVRLSEDERERLDGMLRTGKHSAQMMMKARILHPAAAYVDGPGLSDGSIVEALGKSPLQRGTGRSAGGLAIELSSGGSDAIIEVHLAVRRPAVRQGVVERCANMCGAGVSYAGPTLAQTERFGPLLLTPAHSDPFR